MEDKREQSIVNINFQWQHCSPASAYPAMWSMPVVFGRSPVTQIHLLCAISGSLEGAILVTHIEGRTLDLGLFILPFDLG